MWILDIAISQFIFSEKLQKKKSQAILKILWTNVQNHLSQKKGRLTTHQENFHEDN